MLSEEEVLLMQLMEAGQSVASVVSIDTLSSSASSSFIFPAKTVEMECAHEHRSPSPLSQDTPRTSPDAYDGVLMALTKWQVAAPPPSLRTGGWRPASSPQASRAPRFTGVTGGSESQSSDDLI